MRQNLRAIFRWRRHQTMHSRRCKSHVVAFISCKCDISGLQPCDMSPMSMSLDIVWASLQDHLRSSTHFSSSLSKLIPVRVRECLHTETPLIHEWHRVKRDLEMVLAYVFVFEQQLEELSVFRDFPNVRAKMKLLLCMAKADYLFSLERDNKILFLIAEHLFCMKVIILQKQQVLEEYVTLGVIQQADYSTLNRVYLIPTLQQLNRFVPTPEQVMGTRRKLRLPSLRSMMSKRFDISSSAELRRHHSSNRGRSPSEVLAEIRDSRDTVNVETVAGNLITPRQLLGVRPDAVPDTIPDEMPEVQDSDGIASAQIQTGRSTPLSIPPLCADV